MAIDCVQRVRDYIQTVWKTSTSTIPGHARASCCAAPATLFAGRGYAAVGTEEIVRAAGVTRGALYHQFRDKAALFEAVVEEVEAETTARVAEEAVDGRAARWRPCARARARS